MAGVTSGTKRQLTPIPDTSYQLGTSRRTVYRLIADDQLTAVKIASRTYVTQASIDNFVARLGAAAAEPKPTINDQLADAAEVIGGIE